MGIYLIHSMGSLSLRARLDVARTAARDAFSSREPRLSLITDFGEGDEAVYAVKSSALFVNQRVRIHDICHNVPLGNILLGAWRLQRAVGLPTEKDGTAYVAVIDPGVGSARKNVALRTRDGKFLVGPDNGVLSLASSLRGVEEAVEIENPSLTLLHLARSRTFHGKDVFAPVAGHLLRGVPLSEFGSRLDPGALARISISSGSGPLSRAGFIVDVDGFGSIRTNVPNHVPEAVVGKTVGFTISSPDKTFGGEARVVRTFSEAGKDEAVFVLSSTGCLDLAVNLGSASERFGISARSITVGPSLEPSTRIALDLSSAGG
jgi:S-adenosylmethionine hydrolase